MTVLASPAVRVDGEIFPGNAVNKPFFIVNGGRDRLYPAHVVQLYVEHLRKLGTDVVFRVYPESDHSTAWWPQERAAFEEFVHDHPREPLPDRLSWETERTDRFNRAHGLIIDRLGNVEGESRLADSNLLRRGLEYDFGLRVGDTFVEVNGKPVQTGRDVAEGMQRQPFFHGGSRAAGSAGESHGERPDGIRGNG